MYRYRYNLEPNGYEKFSAARVGTFFHRLVAAATNGVAQPVAVAREGALIEAEVARLQKVYEDNPLLGYRDMSDVQGEMESDLVLARVLSEIFLEKYPLPSGFRVVALELTLRAKQAGLKQALKGTMDFLLYNDSTNELWIVDHKTTSDNTLNTAALAPLQPQVAIYRILVEGAVVAGSIEGVPTNAKVVGFVHNILRKPTIKLRSKPRDTFDVFLGRCREWYAAVGEFASKHDEWVMNPPILQSWYRFSGDPLSAEVGEMLAEQDQVSRSVCHSHKFQTSPDRCFTWGRPCSYLPLCRQPANRAQLVQLHYTRREETETPDHQSTDE